MSMENDVINFLFKEDDTFSLQTQQLIYSISKALKTGDTSAISNNTSAMRIFQIMRSAGLGSDAGTVVPVFVSGNTTTLDAGQPASFNLVPLSMNVYRVDAAIPRGSGDGSGTGSSITNLSIGSVTTLSNDVMPTASFVKSGEGYQLNLCIPQGMKGDKGDKGEKGETGPSGNAGTGVSIFPTFDVDVSAGEPGSEPVFSVTYKGTAYDYKVDVVIPRGADGTGMTLSDRIDLDDRTIGASAKALYNMREYCVNTLYDQDIYGVKTFKKPLYIDTNNGSHLVVINDNITQEQPSSNTVIDLYSLENTDGTNVGGIKLYDYTDYKRLSFEIKVGGEIRGFSVNYNYSTETPSFIPYVDNEYTLGSMNLRFAELYVSNATINTSDAREKENISDIPDEILDAWETVRYYQFQFKDAVEKKGEDKARIHTGLIAQYIDNNFKAKGLEARDYSFFCHDEWKAQPEQKDENGNVIQPAMEAGDRYGIRYEEALCLEAAYQRRRANRLEARIKALEDADAALEANEG